MKKSIISFVLIFAVSISCFVCCKKVSDDISNDVSNDGSVENSVVTGQGGTSGEETGVDSTPNASNEDSKTDESNANSNGSAADESKPDSSKPDSSKPDSSVADGGSSSTSEESGSSEAGSSENSGTESGSEPDSSKPDTSKPESSVPDVSKPDTSKPDTSKPDTSKPESSQPVISQPVISQPVISQPVISQPVISQPVISQPVISQPVISQPVISKPVVSVPESSEESSYVPKDKSDPVMEIPTNFKYDPADEYFKGSVFIGYSIMMHFGRYVNAWRDDVDSRIMSNAVFCAGVSMSFTANENYSPSDPGNPLPKYMGVSYNFEDLPKAMGAKTMVIGLTPYSDMKLQGSTSSCAYDGAQVAIDGIKKIKQQNPNLNIIVLAGTYNTGETNGSLNLRRVNNTNIRTYNNYVLNYCNSAGIDFIDVATPLTNGYGYFLMEWSSDESYHILQDPYKIWVQLLREYATKKQAGTWQNPAVMPQLGWD